MAKKRRSYKLLSGKSRDKKNTEFKISSEILSFLNTQKYFNEFSKEKKGQYILRITNFYKNEYLIKNYKRVLCSNLFMDEQLVRYNPSANTVAFAAFVFIPMLIPIYLALSSYYPELNFLKNISVKYSIFSTVIGLSGALLTGLDILIDQNRLKVWDKYLLKFLDNYKKGWLDSLKVSALVTMRPLGAISYALNSTMQIYLYLYLFRIVDIPNQNTLSVFFFWVGMYLFKERATKGLKYFGLGLTIIQLFILYNNYQLKAFTNSEVFYYLIFSLYCYEISAYAGHYVKNGASRKLYYFAFLILGSPWIIFKSFYRTVPFLFFLPIYSLLRGIIYLKPTSTLRLFGLVLIVIAFFI